MWEPQITTLVTVWGVRLWSIVCTRPLWCVNYGLAQSILSNGDPKGAFSRMIENPIDIHPMVIYSKTMVKEIVV